jgi:hypothetical protein
LVSPAEVCLDKLRWFRRMNRGLVGLPKPLFSLSIARSSLGVGGGNTISPQAIHDVN